MDDAIIPKSSKWQWAPALGAIFGVMGLAVWGMGYRVDPERQMFGYLFAFVSILSIALGCLFFVLVQHLTRAGWSVVVRRIAEFGAATMPLLALLFLPIIFFADHLFPWTHIDPTDAVLQSKVGYLNFPFFLVRALVYFSIWIGLGLWMFRSSTLQDNGGHDEQTKRQWGVSAPGMLLFALSLTFASIDFVMSLQPHWYSTIFGVYFFAGCFLAALAFMTLLIMGLQAAGVLKKSVTFEHYHDLGKFMFGFTVFWAYIAFSQFMLYWYANIPEEIEFYHHRLAHGWETLSYAIPVTNFFIPFFLIMSRHLKRRKIVLAIFCVWTLVFHFVDLFWVILPNYGFHHETIPHMGVNIHDFGALLGMGGLFLALVSFLAVRNNVAPVGDPRIRESLAFENI